MSADSDQRLLDDANNDANNDADVTHPKKKCECKPKEKLRNLIAYFLIGLINNVGYVIMIAGAKEINSGGVGVVFLAAVLPSGVIKLTGPYWWHHVPYAWRTVICAVLMAGSFTLVGVGEGMALKLVGVALSSAQSGFGEASFLALAAKFDSSAEMLTLWSSGTGVAGVAGFAWVVFFHEALQLSFLVTLVTANVWAVLLVVVFFVVLERKDGRSHCGFGKPQHDADSDAEKMQTKSKGPAHSSDEIFTLKKRLRAVLKLWPYMVPLVVVYFAEYSMQTGTWSAIGFPTDSKAARDSFYEYANWSYQVGVFISRSSGTLFKANIVVLWVMAGLQVVMLVLFSLDAVYHVWYSYTLLLPCVFVGLLGGGVYVNAFTLISRKVRPERVEFSLGAASLGDTTGIILSDIFGILLQGCLYRLNEISGATFTCGYTGHHLANHTANTTFF